MSYFKLFVRGFSWTAVVTALAGISAYLFRILLARTFTPAEYGLFFAVLAFPTLFSTVKHLGAGAALTKEATDAITKKNEPHVRTLVKSFLLIELLSYGLTILVLLLVAQPLATSYFHDASSVSLFRLLVAASLFTIVDTAMYGAFIAKKAVRTIGVLNGGRPIIQLAFAAAALLIDKSLFALALSYFIMSGVMALAHFLSYLNLFKKIPASHERVGPTMKMLFVSGLPVLIGITGASLLANGETLVLTGTRTLQEVGVFNVVYPTANLLIQITKMVAFLITPVAAELFLMDKARFASGVAQMQKYSAFVLMPFIIALSTFSLWVITTFFGAQYAVGALALRILAFGAIAQTFLMINGNVLLGIGKYKQYAAVMVGTAIADIALNLLLTPHFGIMGAAISNFGADTVGTIATTMILLRVKQYRFPWWSVLVAFASGIGLSALLTLALPAAVGWFHVIGYSIAGGIAYIVVMVLSRAVTWGELVKLARQVPLVDRFIPGW
jgi:O-antigen/teichoic acid export membrane protein